MARYCLFLWSHSPIQRSKPALPDFMGEDIIDLYLSFSSGWDLRGPVRLCVCSSCNTSISLSQTYRISINTTVLPTGDSMECNILEKEWAPTTLICCIIPNMQQVWDVPNASSLLCIGWSSLYHVHLGHIGLAMCTLHDGFLPLCKVCRCMFLLNQC